MKESSYHLSPQWKFSYVILLQISSFIVRVQVWRFKPDMIVIFWKHTSWMFRSRHGPCIDVLVPIYHAEQNNEKRICKFYNVQTSSKYDNNLLNNNYFFILIKFDINSNILRFPWGGIKGRTRKNSSLTTRGTIGHARVCFVEFISSQTVFNIWKCWNADGCVSFKATCKMPC